MEFFSTDLKTEGIHVRQEQLETYFLHFSQLYMLSPDKNKNIQHDE